LRHWGDDASAVAENFHEELQMSQSNGDKSRFQINRKRAVLRRAKIRALVAVGKITTEQPAHGKVRPTKA
jgi:hypothetical protein